MSATFKYPEALEELQPILYPESDADTQKAKENSEKAQKNAEDSMQPKNTTTFRKVTSNQE